MRTKIIGYLERWSNGSWHWEEANWNGEGSTMFCTNTAGEGLFEYAPGNANYADGKPVYEWKQLLGTCQFSLPANRKAAYMRLYRNWMRNHRETA